MKWAVAKTFIKRLRRSEYLKSAVGWILRIYIILLLFAPIYMLLDTAKTARSYPDADVTVYATPLIAPTVTTDGGATNITETEARLRGEITDTGNENPEVWVFWGQSDGGTDPGSWSDNANLGTLGLGTFYEDISSLTANTTYYYQCRATNTGGTDWAATSANFTTLPAGSVIGVPTDFTIVDLGAITLEISWTKGSSGNFTMIRCSREGYPASITEGELTYYGAASSINSTGYALDPTEYYFSAWGFWTDNVTHSTTYARARVGGEAMEDIASGLNGLATQIQAFVLLIPIVAVSVLAWWSRYAPVFMIAAGVSIITGLKWYDVLTNDAGLTIGLGLIAYAFICLFFSFRFIFWKEEQQSEE